MSLQRALERAAWRGLSFGSELHTGAPHCLLCHHLGLCLINNVCEQGERAAGNGDGGRKRINSVCTWGLTERIKEGGHGGRQMIIEINSNKKEIKEV